ncbi:MAG: GNAT family N-acetyltransferase [Paracoccaceae bacterium]
MSARALTPAPVLDAQRLRLRGPEPGDFDPLAEFFADAPRAWGFGGAETRPDAWRWFASNIGHWHLHGYGYFTIELKQEGRPAGLCGIWNPLGWPEPELGWLVFAPFEGRGIAYEAALRAREWAYAPDGLGFTTLTSNILPGNARSVALAERLGARYERTYDNVAMGRDMLYRHPGPDALDSDGGGMEAYA